MAYRGLDETVAEQQIASVKVQERVKFVDKDNALQLEVADSFQRSWRHMTIAIDRLGYLVEDKNRSAGVFYIQLPDTFQVKTEGFFGSIFSGGFEKPKHDKYLIVLEDKGAQTVVTVKSNGEVTDDFPVVARKMLKDIKDNIL
jgi:outer membrane protein assembly factor BamC